jgi:hypothetical protein
VINLNTRGDTLMMIVMIIVMTAMILQWITVGKFSGKLSLNLLSVKVKVSVSLLYCQ